MVGEDRMEDGYKLLKTRPRLLARFFRQSRDPWKSKCQPAKGVVKSCQVRIRDLQSSREHWRAVAEQEQQKVAQLEQELAQLQSRLDAQGEEPKTRR